MPELPEVETIRRQLEPLIIERVFDCPSLYMPTTIAYPEPAVFESVIKGRKVTTLKRRGKYLLIYLDRGILVVHLRMTGNLLFHVNDQLPDDRFLRLALPFKDGTCLYFSDMRRFGRLWLVEDEHELEEKVLKRIGPDIVNDLDSVKFRLLLEKRKNSRLKALLLDQSFAAGMGNIYTDESLYRCGLHPLRKVSSISSSKIEELYASIRDVLGEGIEHGGTTFRDYRSASGALGDYQSRLAVYGRKGEQCRCGCQISKTVVAGRGTYYCPACQVEWKDGDENRRDG